MRDHCSRFLKSFSHVLRLRLDDLEQGLAGCSGPVMVMVMVMVMVGAALAPRE
jgi:hypothetical protein